MTANTVVGDASFVFYDGHETATVGADFARPVATVDSQGAAVDVNEQRYGDDATYAPPVQWTDSGVATPKADYAKIMATGWDFDDVTPLMVYQDLSHNKLIFYSGENLTVSRNLSVVNNDLMLGAVAGERFAPKAAIIHHGLIVFATVRSVLTNGSYQIVGIDFLATQDYGATFQRVPMADGQFGVPILEAARGLDRLNTWCFENPFPVNGLSDASSVWFPWTDYIYKPGLPKGGQVGLFRADRAPGESHWTLSPNRLVFSQWLTQDSGGLHAHTAAVTLGGMISHWGDVSYRSQTLFHQFDLNNYQTAPVETVFAYGGYSPTVGSEQGASQPVAAAPSPVLGAHLAGGDETPDNILSFGPMTTVTDRLNVTSEVYKPDTIAPGGVYGGAAVLHLQWLQGVGYAAAAVDDDFYYYSPDSEHWARLTLPSTSPSYVWLYGNRLLSPVNGRFWVASLPSVEVLHPLTISPGGINLIDTTLSMRGAPGPGNSARRVVYQESAWRYADTLAPLSIQAPAPTFLSSAPVYEFTMGNQDANNGTWWLQPTGAITTALLPHVSDAWVANLASQELRLGGVHSVANVAAGQYATAVYRSYQINDNTQWVPTGISLDINSNIQGRYSVSLKTIYRNPGARFLVAFPYFGESAAPTYPIAPQSSGPDEVETTSLGGLTDNWTTGFVARWPANAPQPASFSTPIASLTGPGGDAVVWSVFQYGVAGTRLSVEVYKAGVRTSKQDYDTKLLRGDIFETLVSANASGMNFTFRTDGHLPVTFAAPALTGLQLDTFRWAGRDGDVVTGIDPMLLVVDKDKAWSPAEHAQWIASSLEQKAVFNAQPAPGDFNLDGVVDRADFALWESTQEQPVPGRPGDANGDGYVNPDDAATWRQQYGMVGTGIEADFNLDGVVDAADYTVWRDALSTPNVTPGSGADANHDGFIRADDLTAWLDNVGKSYSSLQQLRAVQPSPIAFTAPAIAINMPFASAASQAVSPAAPVANESKTESENAAVSAVFDFFWSTAADPTAPTSFAKASNQLELADSQKKLALLTLSAAIASAVDNQPTSEEWPSLNTIDSPAILDEAFSVGDTLGSLLNNPVGAL